MKTIIAGSRSITDEQVFFKAFHKFKLDISEVVCGGARGADRLGENFAQCTEVPIQYFLPNWNYHGKRAGFIRNHEMGDYADQLLALWDGESRGTLDMINYMKKLGKPVYVYNIKETNE